jgi:hypothetical protein
LSDEPEINRSGVGHGGRYERIDEQDRFLLVGKNLIPQDLSVHPLRKLAKEHLKCRYSGRRTESGYSGDRRTIIPVFHEFVVSPLALPQLAR